MLGGLQQPQSCAQDRALQGSIARRSQILASLVRREQHPRRHDESRWPAVGRNLDRRNARLLQRARYQPT